MPMSKTSSPSTARPPVFSEHTWSAFSDELEKIASTPKERKEKLKKWARSAGAITAGTALGTGAYMVGERILSNAVGQSWQKLQPSTRLAILGPLAGGAGVLSAAMLRRLAEEKQKAER
jgi:hypothetical protein